MTRDQIVELQKRVGTTPDGFWGPQSTHQCRRHVMSFMPMRNPWPETDQASLTRFYGKPGDESKLVNLDVYALGVKYEGKTVRTIRCHERVAGSLHQVLTEISKGPHAAILGQYAGVYNNRPMRGGSLPSLHARGAAIDLAPATNGNLMHWPTRANMHIEIAEVFAKQSWVSAGPFWSRDAMHHQATR